MYVIDGREGGGSVLRVAVPLALAQGKSIKVTNIRSNRKKPGLRTQHLLGLNLLEKVSGGSLTGGRIGSTEIIFTPVDNFSQEEILLEIGTAASISLILQIAINYSLASRQDIYFSFHGGGTYTEWSPSIDYCKYVLHPIFKIIGLEITFEIDKQGYFPKGGASGFIRISFQGNKRFNFINEGKPKILIYSSASSNLTGARVAERQIAGYARKAKFSSSNVSYYNTESVGTSILACMQFPNGIFKGKSVNGKRGLKAEKVGELLSDKVIAELSKASSVDKHMADQLLVALALSPNDSGYTIEQITDHVEINLTIIKQILGNKISITDKNEYFELKKI